MILNKNAIASKGYEGAKAAVLALDAGFAVVD